MSAKTVAKRCVCGRSSRFPLCDGQHGAEGWRCAPSEQLFHRRVVVGSPHYHSLVEQLAHEHGMVALHLHPEVQRCTELVVVHDSDDLEPLRSQIDQVVHSFRRVIGVDVPPSPRLLRPGEGVALQVSADSLKGLLMAVIDALHAAQSDAVELPGRLFVSHAVVDEARLLPAIHRLRAQYGVDVFLCADTIAAGVEWRGSIDAALRGADVVVAVCSAAFNASSFCAYEIGYAAALQKEIRPILLDTAPPPAFLQHLNAPSVARIQRNHPWFNDTDAIGAALFDALKGYGTST